MNFCVGILILKMEEDMQHDILCFIISRKVKTQLKRKKTLHCAVYGEGAVTDQACQKWLAKFLGTMDILAK